MAIPFSQVTAQNLKMKVLPRFPANVEAGTAISIEKESGTYTIGLDYSGLQDTNTFDPAVSEVAVWNPDTDVYNRTSLTDFFNASVSAPTFDSIAPTSARGDIIYRNATTNTRLGVGTSGYHLQTNGAGADPSWVGFLATGTGAGTRTWQSKSSDFLSVKDFRATGDGVTDDTAAIQAAITAGIANSKAVYVPGGSYIVSSNLLADLSAVPNVTAPRFTLFGDGCGATRFLFANGNYSGLTIQGGATFALESFANVRGILFQKSDRLGSGINVEIGAYITIENVYLEGWSNGFHGLSFLSSKLDRVISRSNTCGIYLENGSSSAPNAVTLNACVISANREYGILATKPTTLVVNGGSIENNGILGVAGDRCGALILGGALQGGAGAVFNGVYFEDNAIIADIYVSASDNPTTISAIGCTFNRISNVNYTTNNIRSDGTQETKIYVAGCAFKRLGTYAANAARPYFSMSATSKLFLDGNTYSDATEQGSYENRPSIIKGGQVSSAGASVVLPIGWTSSKSSTGVYVVTHNLGTANYGVAVSSTDSSANLVQRVVPAANSFTVATTNTSAVATDCPFGFVLALA